jgi:hypothetical protein
LLGEDAVAKRVLRNLDVAALAVALDRAEEAGLTARTPAPKERPGECVYLKYVGNEQLGLLTTRLPHAMILRRTPGGAGRNKKYVVVFDAATVQNVLGFLLDAEEVKRCTRSLDTVEQRYWRVLRPDEHPS